MKKLICILLCLLTLVTLLAGCKNKNTPDNTDATLPGFNTEATEAEPDGIHFCGLNAAKVSAEQLASALGLTVDQVIKTETGSGEELLIVNDVLYETILYKQLQCINYEDKTVITLTYFLDDEEMDGALTGIVNTLEPKFGAPSNATSGSGETTYTFRAPAFNENYIYLYPLSENEIKLSFYLY